MKKLGLFKHAAVLLLVDKNKRIPEQKSLGKLSDKRCLSLIKGGLGLSGGLIYCGKWVFLTDILEAGQQLAGDFDIFSKHGQRSGPQAKIAIQGAVNHQPFFCFTVTRNIYDLIVGAFIVLVVAWFQRGFNVVVHTSSQK